MLEKHILQNNGASNIDSRIPIGYPMRQVESKFPTFLKIGILSVFLCVLFVMTIVALLRMPSVQIRQVSVFGAAIANPNDISDTAMRFLSEKKLFSIPRGNSVFFKKSSLEDYLEKTYPMIETIESSFIEPYHIQINVQEYVQTYLWCTNNLTVDCYRVTETGLIYDHAPDYSRGVYPIVITGLNQDTGILGKKIFSDTTEQQHIQEIIHELTDSGFMVTMIDTSSVYDYQLFVNALEQQPLTNHTYIKVSKKPQTIPLHETLQLLLRDKIFQRDLIKKTLEYIDIRFPEKIFYKFNNSTYAPELLDKATATN